MVSLICMVCIGLITCMSVLASEPFSLGVALVSCALMVCILLCQLNSSLLGFLVFMSYVGGVMVLFLYVLSVHPNQVHKIHFHESIFMFCSLISVVIIAMWYQSSFVVPSKLESYSYVGMESYWKLNLIMAVILLYALLVVCFLCMKKRSPLRSLK
nr:NADH dehydrogenase subunit 6 [Semimytilus algosus]